MNQQSECEPGLQPNMGVNIAAWDQLAEVFVSTFPLDHLRLRNWTSLTDRVLDYGCGNGRTTAWLFQSGYSNVVGCDASSRMCEIALKRTPGSRIQWISNPIKPNVGSEQFDAIVLVGVLSSTFPVSGRESLMTRLCNALKPKGVILVGEFGRSTNSYYTSKYGLASEAGTFLTREGVWIHHFHPTELIALAEVHFEVVDVRTAPVSTTHGNILPGHVVVARRK